MSETISHELSKILADTYQLYLKTHGYHWNVRGMQFNSLHQMFMVQYTEMWGALDVIAERIRALGSLAPMTSHAYGNLSAIGEGNAELGAIEMLTDLKQSHQTIIQTLKSALLVAEELKDAPTVDLITQRLSIHEKTLWMIEASLS